MVRKFKRSILLSRKLVLKGLTHLFRVHLSVEVLLKDLTHFGFVY